MKHVFAALCLSLLPGFAMADVITVMTDRSLSELRPLIAAYEKVTGDRIQIIRPRGNVVETLEQRFDTIKADVFLTEDVDSLRALRDAELTEPVWTGALGAEARSVRQDPENHWFVSMADENTGTNRLAARTSRAENLTGMALLITSHNVNAAIQFMEFLVSDEGREIEANRKGL